MGAATYGTRRLAGSAAHAGPLLIDTGMAEGSWCAGMGTGCWPLACGCQVGGSWHNGAHGIPGRSILIRPSSGPGPITPTAGCVLGTRWPSGAP